MKPGASSWVPHVGPGAHGLEPVSAAFPGHVLSRKWTGIGKLGPLVEDKLVGLCVPPPALFGRGTALLKLWLPSVPLSCLLRSVVLQAPRKP